MNRNEILRRLAEEEAEEGSERFIKWLDEYMECRGGADEVIEVVRLAFHCWTDEGRLALERASKSISDAFANWLVDNPTSADLDASLEVEREEDENDRDYADAMRDAYEVPRPRLVAGWDERR